MVSLQQRSPWLAVACCAMALSANPAAAAPREAVARIVVDESGGTAYGSGALVDARGEYGLVVTNWHVVRDAAGKIEVVFPNGFRSEARRLKLDEDWDLAALVIWRPPVEPLPLALQAPRPGERLTICGYGAGAYREATGRCTEYYSPDVGMPMELVELDVEARQGDSGGPILNERGQIAGVLFGAGQGTTLGSFGGRVGHFLATLAPHLGAPHSPAAAPKPALEPVFEPQNDPPLVAAASPQAGWRQDLAPPSALASGVPESPTEATAEIAPRRATSDRYADWSPAIDATAPEAVAAGPGEPATPTTAPVAAMPPADMTPITAPAWFDEAKTIFALIGVVFVLLQMIRLVT